MAALSLPAWLATAAENKPASRQPNIILILADDLGLGDVSCCGGHYPTPNLDALAKGGTRFEYSYATPLCGPSRCQLLTGRYPFRTGLINNSSEGAVQPHREVMIPTVLKKAGYVTASVGKWGQIAHGPGQWGFDEYLVFPGSGVYRREQKPDSWVNSEHKELGYKYLPELMHDFLVDFLARRKDQPFFIYYPMSHVHMPIIPTPDSQPNASRAQLYADNLAYMDKLVGKLVAELDRLQLRDNTLILFAGDNGTADPFAKESTVNGRPLSGCKHVLLEGGSRVPLIANWPGTTPAGVVNRDLTDFSDFFATCAEVAGATLPAGVTLDSHSFAPQLKGAKGQPRDWVYVELDGKSYACDTRYKLTNTGALFDLKDAPFTEVPVPADTQDAAALAARKRLQEVLDQHPAKILPPKPVKKSASAPVTPPVTK